MKNSQTSALFKAICVFLSCLFFAMGATVATTGILESNNTSFWNDSYYRSIYGDNRLAYTYLSTMYLHGVSQQYQYDQKMEHGKTPTPSERYDYEKTMEQLRSENTNFRYRILDLDGKVLYSNLSGSEDLSKVCSYRYYSSLILGDGAYVGDFYHTISADNGFCGVQHIFDEDTFYHTISADNGTLEDYLHQNFIQDDGKYYDRNSYEEYLEERRQYEELKRERDAATESVAQDDEVSRSLAKRKQIDGFFDDQFQFWHYSATMNTFLQPEYFWEGGTTQMDDGFVFGNQLTYHDDVEGLRVAKSFMSPDGFLYYLMGDSGYAKSTEKFDPEWDPEQYADQPVDEALANLEPPKDFRVPLSAVIEWGIQDAAMDVNGIDDEF
ncbi:MAG: hypothetical protein MJ077_08580, partial [Oscillospiraceae bacterium]|nr:hypothetical protein [Oscillospiraceae bacterium]